MNTITKTTAALGLSLAMALAQSHVALARSKNAGKVLGGIAAGVAGAIIVNEIAKQQRRDRYHGNGHYRPRLSCRELDRRCYHGSDWACRKFDRHC